MQPTLNNEQISQREASLKAALAAFRSIAIRSLIEDQLAIPEYDPAALIAYLMRRMNLKSQVALARALMVEPPTISHLVHRNQSVTPGLMIRMHEVFGISIAELRMAAGLPAKSI